jgi:hypothetical protein
LNTSDRNTSDTKSPAATPGFFVADGIFMNGIGDEGPDR